MRMLVQVSSMLGDVVIVASLVALAINNPPLAVLATWAIHVAQRDVGGWFFAWRPSSIRALRDNWPRRDR